MNRRIRDVPAFTLTLAWAVSAGRVNPLTGIVLATAGFIAQ
jgi:hypothetical protein